MEVMVVIKTSRRMRVSMLILMVVSIERIVMRRKRKMLW